METNFPKEIEYQLPIAYGENRLILMVRDPYCLYAYWEIGEDKLLEIMNNQIADRQNMLPVLRIYRHSPNVEGNNPSPDYFDIELSGNIGNLYIPIEWPNSIFYAEIGLVREEGNFLAILKSNPVPIPPIPRRNPKGTKG